MSKDYRAIYEKELKIKLKPGIASIHHLNSNHLDNCFNNLVAIPSYLHESLNITFAKFSKTAQIVLKAKCYWLVRTKVLQELQNHIKNYMVLRQYIDLRNVIKKQGIDRAIEIFGKEFIEEIIILEKDK